jgi:N-acyl-D-aspartate/D-glutamate deacylase
VIFHKSLAIAFMVFVVAASPATAADETYDVAIVNGRVIDPESGLDAVRNVGLRAGKIATISTEAIQGRRTIDAKGLVVAPGFIDLHEHGQAPENYQFQAHDGVTTSLELEAGTGDVAAWYAEREGKSLINFGVSVGHIPTRMKVMKDPGRWLPTGDAAHRAATDAELAQIDQRIEAGLNQGALAVGMGINYTAAATRGEVLNVFRVAARHGAPVHVHLRYAGDKAPETGRAALDEVLTASTETKAPLHVVHVSSMEQHGIARYAATARDDSCRQGARHRCDDGVLPIRGRQHRSRERSVRSRVAGTDANRLRRSAMGHDR